MDWDMDLTRLFRRLEWVTPVTKQISRLEEDFVQVPICCRYGRRNNETTTAF